MIYIVIICFVATWLFAGLLLALTSLQEKPTVWRFLFYIIISPIVTIIVLIAGITFIIILAFSEPKLEYIIEEFCGC